MLHATGRLQILRRHWIAALARFVQAPCEQGMTIVSRAWLSRLCMCAASMFLAADSVSHGGLRIARAPALAYGAGRSHGRRFRCDIGREFRHDENMGELTFLAVVESAPAVGPAMPRRVE